MEAIAAVGLVAAITQFVAYSTRVIERLNDFRASAQDAPNTFNTLSSQLRILRTNLEKTKLLAETGQIDDGTQEDVKIVVQDCFYQMHRIEAVLSKVEPKGGESQMRRGVKIFLSVHREKKIKSICQCLETYVLHLVHHQTLTIQTTLSSRPLPKRPNLSMMPFPKDDNFTGRQQELSQLDAIFQSGSSAALFGLGGVGKSQIAIEYSHRFLQTDPGAIVLWIYASSIPRIDQAFQEIAAKAKLPGFNDPDISKYKLVSDWLTEEAAGSWLMILDNADAEDTFFSPLDSALHSGGRKTFSDFIPTAPNGKALITSRSKSIATKLTHRNRVIEIPHFSETDGHKMLANAIGEGKTTSEAEVKKLLAALEYLPLAIAQAAAYIEENDITITDYLDMLEDGDQSLLDTLGGDIEDSRRDRDSLNSVLATWELSFRYLRDKKPQAAHLLSLMSMFDGKSIPQRLLLSAEWKKYDFLQAVGTLKSLSLINEESQAGGPKKFNVHRLIHLATRLWVEKERKADIWHQKALNIMETHFPAGDVGDWIECNELEPHVKSITDFETADETFQVRLIALLLRSARDRFHQYHSDDAMKRASKALTLSQNLSKISEREIWTAKSLVVVSWCHFAVKNSEMAVKVGEEALKLFEAILGEDAQETMQARSRLSKFLMKKGDLNKAYEIQDEILKLQRAKMGVNHPDTLFTMNRLVATLRKLKRYDEALALSSELVKARCKVSGEDHPDTLTALFNRAELLNTMGNRQEAIVAMQRAYEGHRRIFGEEREETKEALTCLQRYEKELRANVKTRSSAGDEDGDEENGTPAELVFSPALGSPDPAPLSQWPFPVQKPEEEQ